ncbi:Urokinase plasminogen activator surface receptor [Varanus komodoensis]|nr:Urokinase plasminogen activator surface receptor [Varanus komodoensis]
MAKAAAILLLSTFITQAFCLQCNTCHGEYDCLGENVTCEEPFASCTTSIRKAYVSFLEFQSVRKGCARQLNPLESVSLSSHLMSLSYQARYCAEDGCNNETYFVSHPAPNNHMRCHTCASQGAWCPEASRTQITCVGDQDQCMDLDITGKLGQYSNMKMKGCTNLQRCGDILSFYSGSRTISASCCDTPLCNTFTPDLNLRSQVTNGLECYSCVDEDGSGAGCSKEAMSKVQCTGIHNMCLEGIGNSRKAGQDFGIVTFKGCASPAMCHSSLLALVQELDNAEVMCCQGSLCNDRIVDGMVTAARVAPDSAGASAAPECATPVPTPAGVTPDPDCVYTDEEEEDMGAYIPAGGATAPGSHLEKETTHTPHEKEGHESAAAEGHAVAPHHDHSATGGPTVHEHLLGGASEGNVAAPTAVTDAERFAAGGSSHLDKSDSEAATSSSADHDNEVVLVPIIVPKKNLTAATTTSSSSSSSSGTSGSKEVLAASDADDAAEDEECEAEEEDATAGKPFVAAEEGHREGSFSTNPTESSHNAGVFTAEEYGSTPSASPGSTNPARGHTVHTHSSGGESAFHDGSPASHSPRPGPSMAGGSRPTSGEHLAAEGSNPRLAQPSGASSLDEVAESLLPIPYITQKDNESFIMEGKTEVGAPAATRGPAEAVLISGAGAGTPRPKIKRPCKRPGSQSRPGVNLLTLPEGSNLTPKEAATVNTTASLPSNARTLARNAGGKGTLESGVFGLMANPGLFLLTLLLAALFH